MTRTHAPTYDRDGLQPKLKELNMGGDKALYAPLGFTCFTWIKSSRPLAPFRVARFLGRKKPFKTLLSAATGWTARGAPPPNV